MNRGCGSLPAADSSRRPVEELVWRAVTVTILALMLAVDGGCQGGQTAPAGTAFHPSSWRRETLLTAAMARRPGWHQVADFDRDGQLDFVTSIDPPGGRGSVRIFLHAGRSGWKDVAVIDPDVGSNSNAGVVSDWNGDGWPDVAVIDGAGLAWYENPRTAAGSGGEAAGAGGPAVEGPPVELAGGWRRHAIDEDPSFSHDLLLCDLDRDGRGDILLARRSLAAGAGERAEAAELCAYLGPQTPDGSWRRIKVGPYEDAGLACADFNGDGAPDVVAFDRLFAQPRLEPGALLSSGSWEGRPYTDTYRPSTIVVDDLDGDGRLDIVLTEGHSHRVGRGRIAVLFNDGGQTPSFEPVELGRLANPEGIDRGDLDGDGDLDLVVVAFNGIDRWDELGGDIVLFENLGERRFRGPYMIQHGWYRVGHQLSLVDLDQDGRLDIFCHNVGARKPQTPAIVVYFGRSPDGDERDASSDRGAGG